MEVAALCILVILTILIALTLRAPSHSHDSEYLRPGPNAGQPSTQNHWTRFPPPSSLRPLRADAEEVFPLVFDAQECVVRRTQSLAYELLEKSSRPQTTEFLKQVLDATKKQLDTIGDNRQKLQSTIDNMPEDQVLLVPDFDQFMSAMLDQWLRAMHDDWLVAVLSIDYNQTLAPDQHRAEEARLALNAVTDGIVLLDEVKMAGAVSAENVRERVAALLVDLALADGHICTNELAFLNRVFAREWTSERYLSRYSAYLGGDKAAKELVALIEELRGHNRNVSIFLDRTLEPVISHAIMANCREDAADLNKLASTRELLRQRIGASDALHRTAQGG